MWQLELAKYVPEFERKAAQITANKERFAQVRAFCIRRGLGVSIMRDFWVQVGDGKLSMRAVDVRDNEMMSWSRNVASGALGATHPVRKKREACAMLSFFGS